MTQDGALEDVVELLDRYHVRATYGAVAGYLGRPAAFLMAKLDEWLARKRNQGG